MIAHDRQGTTRVDHGPDDLKGFSDLRASVNEVAQKDSLPLGVVVDALVLGVAECREEVYKLAGMPVDVSNEVVQGGVNTLHVVWLGLPWSGLVFAA